MPDREKVIKALELCVGKHECIKQWQDEHCPYEAWLGSYDDLFDECTSKLAKDALSLLKEQDAVVRCKCGWRYCPSCGARMNGVKLE